MDRIYFFDFDCYAVGFTNGIFREPEFVMVNLSLKDALSIFYKEQSKSKK